MEDARIIDLFFERSESAIQALQEKYGKLLNHVAVNVLRNSSDAEECCNDTLLGVWNTIPPTRPDSLVSYVCKITRNLALKRYEYNTAEKRNSYYDSALEEIEEMVSSASSVEAEIEGKELTEAIDTFLASLEKTDRVIFMRRYYFADSYEYIASLTVITVKNVSVKLTRIRKLLKNYLKERGYLS